MDKIEYLEYTTITGDRWDLLAYKFYADLNLMEKIIIANPTVPLFERFPAGVELKIPVLDEHIAMNKQLPKWMRFSD